MTKKDYIKVAAILKSRLQRTTDVMSSVVIRAIAADLADMFLADNDRFDRQRFLTACGL